MKSSKGRPYSSDLATRPRPVVCPYSPNTCLSSSSPAAPGLSILLPRIRMGQELSCSSVNKASSSTLLSTNLNNTSTFKFKPSDCMICVIWLVCLLQVVHEMQLPQAMQLYQNLVCTIRQEFDAACFFLVVSVRLYTYYRIGGARGTLLL